MASDTGQPSSGRLLYQESISCKVLCWQEGPSCPFGPPGHICPFAEDNDEDKDEGNKDKYADKDEDDFDKWKANTDFDEWRAYYKTSTYFSHHSHPCVVQTLTIVSAHVALSVALAKLGNIVRTPMEWCGHQ